MYRSLFRGLVVTELVDASAVGDLFVDDGVERLGQTVQPFVDGLPGGGGKVDAVIDLVPKGSCTIGIISHRSQKSDSRSTT